MGVGWAVAALCCRHPLRMLASSPPHCDAPPLAAAKIWEGVANRYWRLPVYFVPTCVLKAADGEAEAAQQGGDASAAAAAEAAAGQAGAAGAGGGAGS